MTTIKAGSAPGLQIDILVSAEITMAGIEAGIGLVVVEGKFLVTILCEATIVCLGCTGCNFNK